jgi:hypothetical protein
VWNIQGHIGNDTAAEIVRQRQLHKVLVWFFQEVSPLGGRNATPLIFLANNDGWKQYAKLAWLPDQCVYIQGWAGIVIDDPAIEVIAHRCTIRVAKVTVRLRGLAGLTHLMSIYAPADKVARG